MMTSELDCDMAAWEAKTHADISDKRQSDKAAARAMIIFTFCIDVLFMPTGSPRLCGCGKSLKNSAGKLARETVPVAALSGFTFTLSSFHAFSLLASFTLRFICRSNRGRFAFAMRRFASHRKSKFVRTSLTVIRRLLSDRSRRTTTDYAVIR